MNDPLRFGIVGTGLMAAEMVFAMRSTEGVAPIRVASRDPARARRFAEAFGLAGVAEDVEALCAAPDVDAVYVATAPGAHAPACLAAIRAGKPVLREKPLAASAAAAEETLAAAEATGTLLVEGLWTLVLPAYRRFFEIARSDALGAPVLFDFDFGYPVEPGEGALFDPSNGGVLLDRAVYGAAFAISLFGAPRSVASAVRRNATGLDVSASLQLEHEGGVISRIAASLEALTPNRASLACARGLLALAPTSLASEGVAVSAAAPQCVRRADPAPPGLATRLKGRLRGSPVLRRVNALRSGPRLEWHPYGATRYGPLLRHFAALVASGAVESDVIPQNLSRAVLALTLSARAQQVPDDA